MSKKKEKLELFFNSARLRKHNRKLFLDINDSGNYILRLIRTRYDEDDDLNDPACHHKNINNKIRFTQINLSEEALDDIVAMHLELKKHRAKNKEVIETSKEEMKNNKQLKKFRLFLRQKFSALWDALNKDPKNMDINTYSLYKGFCTYLDDNFGETGVSVFESISEAVEKGFPLEYSSAFREFLDTSVNYSEFPRETKKELEDWKSFSNTESIYKYLKSNPIPKNTTLTISEETTIENASEFIDKHLAIIDSGINSDALNRLYLHRISTVINSFEKKTKN